MQKSHCKKNRNKNLFQLSNNNPLNGISYFKWIIVLLLIFNSPEFCSQGLIITEESKSEAIEEQGDLGEFDFSGTLEVEGLVSSQHKLPFWMYQNRKGRITETTNIAGLFSGAMNYNMGYSNLKIGGGVLFQDGLNDQLQVDELYAHFTTFSFYLTAGKKHQKELYYGLSSSNRNILWSLNAPAVPGIQLGTNGPLFFSGISGLGVEGSWNAYLLEENRHVEHTRLHRANFFLVYRTESDFQIKAGIDHFAQWGGNSNSIGQIEGGAKDYLEIITGQEDAGTGNHLGSYEIYVQKNLRDFYLEFFYNYLYEDNNRMAFGNFPDGRYGLFLNFTDRERTVDKVLYELTYTKNQSYKGSGGYNQDYFNNSIYTSGWTFMERVLGSPFFTYNREQDQIVNNKFIMHHLGVSGAFSNYFNSYPYKLLISGGRNDGTFKNRFFPNEDVLYFSYEMLLWQNFVDINVKLAGEYNSLASPVYGAGVSLKKRF